MVLNAGNFATQAMCLPGDEGNAAATYLFLRQLGAAVGVGTGGSVFQNVMAAQLARDGLPRAVAEQAEGLVTELLAAAADDADELALQEGARVRVLLLAAYDAGFTGVFALYLGTAAAALLLSLLFIRHFPLDKVLGSEHRLGANRVTRILGGNAYVEAEAGAEDAGADTAVPEAKRLASSRNNMV